MKLLHKSKQRRCERLTKKRKEEQCTHPMDTTQHHAEEEIWRQNETNVDRLCVRKNTIQTIASAHKQHSREVLHSTHVPIHGEWNLDLEEQSEQIVDIDRTLTLLLKLPEGLLNQLLQILLNVQRRKVQDEIETCLSRHDRSINRSEVFTLCRELNRSFEEFQNNVIKAMQNKGNANTSHHRTITGPGLFRVRERDLLLIPNYRSIIDKHFANENSEQKTTRALFDIGSWDGRIPRALGEFFGMMTAIEPNAERFKQLEETILQSSRSYGTFNGFQANLEEIMSGENRAIKMPSPNVVLLSHVMYFLHSMGNDTKALHWIHDHLCDNGMCIVALNDQDETMGSRAHVRRVLGGRDQAKNPREYQLFLARQGIETEVLQPELHLTASTEQGYAAMQEAVTYLLPAEARVKSDQLKQYIQYLQNYRLPFVHRTCILVMKKTKNPIPQPKITYDDIGYQRPEPIDDAIIFTPVRRIVPQPKAKEHAKSTVQNFQALHRVRINELSAEEQLNLLERIGERSNNGIDDIELQKALEECGISRYEYRKLYASREELEARLRSENHTGIIVNGIVHRKDLPKVNERMIGERNEKEEREEPEDEESDDKEDKKENETERDDTEVEKEKKKKEEEDEHPTDEKMSSDKATLHQKIKELKKNKTVQEAAMRQLFERQKALAERLKKLLN